MSISKELKISIKKKPSIFKWAFFDSPSRSNPVGPNFMRRKAVAINHLNIGDQLYIVIE